MSNRIYSGNETSRICTTCRSVLPLSMFPRNIKHVLGVESKCRECFSKSHRDSCRKYAEANRDKIRDKNKRHRSENSAYYQMKYNEARLRPCGRARIALNNAVRDGRIVRPESCDECGAVCKVHGHHDDYSHPFCVRWLCSSCHGLVHRKKPELSEVSK